VLTSEFHEGTDDPSKPGHRTIKVTEDFDVLYAILYYLYTGRITFDTYANALSITGPKIIDSAVIYAQADRLLLRDLKKIAFEFFKSALGIYDVTTYTFDEDLCLHKEIDDYCSKFFSKHVEEIVETDEYIKFFAELEKCPMKRQAWVDSKFRKLVQNGFGMRKQMLRKTIGKRKREA
jgi:hypothetical protein